MLYAAECHGNQKQYWIELVDLDEVDLDARDDEQFSCLIMGDSYSQFSQGCDLVLCVTWGTNVVHILSYRLC